MLAAQPRISTGPILVVDDDEAIREAVADLLRGEGYRAETAADGPAGLEAAQRLRPALVLLDMRLPRLDGWALAGALRARAPRVPILAMTAATDARRWAAEIGADGWIAKPFDVDELFETIERLLGQVVG